MNAYIVGVLIAMPFVCDATSSKGVLAPTLRLILESRASSRLIRSSNPSPLPPQHGEHRLSAQRKLVFCSKVGRGDELIYCMLCFGSKELLCLKINKTVYFDLQHLRRILTKSDRAFWVVAKAISSVILWKSL